MKDIKNKIIQLITIQKLVKKIKLYYIENLKINTLNYFLE